MLGEIQFHQEFHYSRKDLMIRVNSSWMFNLKDRP
jgi:hypothetical protein